MLIKIATAIGIAIMLMSAILGLVYIFVIGFMYVTTYIESVRIRILFGKWTRQMAKTRATAITAALECLRKYGSKETDSLSKIQDRLDTFKDRFGFKD